MSASRKACDLLEPAQMGGASATGRPVEIPMTQQCAHGGELQPQEFVRLSGCQEFGPRTRLRTESNSTLGGDT